MYRAGMLDAKFELNPLIKETNLGETRALFDTSRIPLKTEKERLPAPKNERAFHFYYHYFFELGYFDS